MWHRVSPQAAQRLAARAHRRRIRIVWDAADALDYLVPDDEQPADDFESPPDSCTVSEVDAGQLLLAGCGGHAVMDGGRPLLTVSVASLLACRRLEVVDRWLGALPDAQVRGVAVLRVLRDLRAGGPVAELRRELWQSLQPTDPEACLVPAVLLGTVLDAQDQLHELLGTLEDEAASPCCEPALLCELARIYRWLLEDADAAERCLLAAEARAAIFTADTLTDTACGWWDCFEERERVGRLLREAEERSRPRLRMIRAQASLLAQYSWLGLARAQWLLLGQEAEAERCLREAEGYGGSNPTALLDLASVWMALWGDREHASRLIALAASRGGARLADAADHYRRHVLGLG